MATTTGKTKQNTKTDINCAVPSTELSVLGFPDPLAFSEDCCTAVLIGIVSFRLSAEPACRHEPCRSHAVTRSLSARECHYTFSTAPTLKGRDSKKYKQRILTPACAGA